MGTYVRNNAWDKGGDFTNQDLLWYARGVGKMMSRALDDTASWWFYAAIHGEYVTPAHTRLVRPPGFPDWKFIQGPPAVPISPLPSRGIRDLFWNQCQHGTWYFLPWHRGYLLALEAQLRADIVSLGGPETWALPYWDYFGGPHGAQYAMPPAFGETKLDGAPNPLHCAMRYGPEGDGKIYVSTPAWEAAHPNQPAAFGDVKKDCLQNDLFTGSDMRTTPPGFGGPEGGFSHSGRVHGNLESNPHDLVHVYVGGEISQTQAGLMSDPGTAALDPLFYLHHCNIDRLWAGWNAAGSSNPTSAAWLNGPTRHFVMPWPGQKPWYYTPLQMANLQELNYTYKDLGAPAPPGPSILASRLANLGAADAAKRVSAGLALRTLPKPPELVGASEGPTEIQGAGAPSVAVKLDPSLWREVGASLAAASETTLPDRVFLNLEDVRGTSDSTVLGAYVNLADDAAPKDRRASLAGRVSLFGLRRASASDGDHGGSGLSFVLDITHLVDEMYLKKAFDVGSVQVSLLPRRPLPAQAKITVDRISLYRESH
jgi:tyrosinase